MTRMTFLLALAILVTGCARRDGYPSLAPRAVERAANAPATSPPPVAPLPTDSARLGRLEEAVRTAESTQASFSEALAKAQSAVASAGAKGGDRWIAAQLMVSRLEASRGGTGDALARIDEERKAMIAAGPSADSAALEAAHARALAVDQAQEAAVRALARRLGGY